MLVGSGAGIAVGDASSAVITGNLILSNVSLRSNVPWTIGAAGWHRRLGPAGDDRVQHHPGNTGNEAGGGGSGGGIGLWTSRAPAWSITSWLKIRAPFPGPAAMAVGWAPGR